MNNLHKTNLENVFVVMIGLLLMVGCAEVVQAPGATARPESEATAPTMTPTRVKPTRTPLPEMRTATAQAKITPFPSSTPLPTPPREIWSSTSPDGEWVAKLIWEEAMHEGTWQYHLLFTVARQDNSVEWRVGDEWGWGLGYSQAEPLMWSSDSQRFYFTGVWVADGGCPAFGNRSGVSWVDVADGRVTALDVPEGSQHSLSPDEEIVAYIAHGKPPTLVLYNRTTKNERRLTLGLLDTEKKYSEAGNIVWSPDGIALAFAIADGLCTSRVASAIVRVDMATLTQTVLTRVERHLIRVVGWTAPDRLAIGDWYGQMWQIDAQSGEVVLDEVKRMTSPDGRWIAQLFTALQPASEFAYDSYTRFQVTRTDDSVRWVLVDGWEEIGLGGTTPLPFHFSRDERYFYYVEAGVGDGCGYPFSHLQRLDLNHGDVTAVVPFTLGPVSLSPDETTLAYGTLTLLDMASGLTQTVTLADVPAAALADALSVLFVWSPDSQQVMWTLALNACGPYPTHLIVRVDAETRAAAILLRDETHFTTAFEWPEPERVLLRDNDGNVWWMNPNTGELVQADP